MITSLVAGLCFAQGAEQVPYNVDTFKVKPGENQSDKIIRICHTPTPGIALIVMKDNELRWTDITKPGSNPIRTAKLEDVPNFVFSGKQAVDVEKARKATIGMFGSDDYHPLQGIGLYPFNQHKQFVLSNGHEQFYFYDSMTGKLDRKVILEKPSKYGQWGVQFSSDGKLVLTGMASDSKMFVHSLETGKQLLSIPRGIMDSAALSADGKGVFHMSKGVISTYSIATGKVLPGQINTEKPSSGLLTVNPDGSSLAFCSYNAKGGRDGNHIYNFATKKMVRVDPRADNVAPYCYSPDGKFLVLYEARWLYFIDAKTGAIRCVVEAAPHAMWDYLYYGIDISDDSKTLLLTPDPAQNDARYGVIAYLDKPLRPVKVFGPRKGF